MAQSVSRRFHHRLLIFIVAGLSGLGFLLWYLLRSRPKAVILRTLKAAGVSEQTAKFWVCVSAFETSGWTSRAFKEGNNLVGMTLPPSKTTAIGLIPEPNPEKLAAFSSVKSAADDLVLFLFARWAYPRTFVSIVELVAYMKARNYFEGDQSIYTQGCQEWYTKLFG